MHAEPHRRQRNARAVHAALSAACFVAAVVIAVCSPVLQLLTDRLGLSVDWALIAGVVAVGAFVLGAIGFLAAAFCAHDRLTAEHQPPVPEAPPAPHGG